MDIERLEPILYLPDDTPYFPENGDTRQWRRLGLRAIALAVLAAIAFVPTFGAFVWQDERLIAQNPALRTLGGLAAIWTHADGGAYHPVALTAIWVQYRLSGANAFTYHGASLLLHVFNTIALWFVLRRLNLRGAWLGAALFAVHPVQVQAVAWATQQPHLLASAFLLTAAWAFLRLSGIQPPLPLELAPGAADEIDDVLPGEPVELLYVVALFCAVMAVLTDPIGASLPAVVLLLVWWKRGAVSRLDWRRLVPFILLAIAGLTATVYSAFVVVDPLSPGGNLSFVQRLSAAGGAIAFYVAKIIWPYPVLFVYSRWQLLGWQIVFPLGVAALLVILWMNRRKWGRGPLAATGIYLTLLLPSLLVFLRTPPPGIFVADHLQYLAAAVPLALIAWLIVRLLAMLASPILERSLRAGIALACLAGLVTMTIVQGFTYSGEDRVWTDTLAYEPTSAVPRTQYALLLLSRRDREDAADLLRGMTRSDEYDVALLLARAQLYVTQSRYSDAIACYTQAQRLSPRNRQIPVELALAYENDGRKEEALRAYTAALEQNPNNEDVQNRIGALLQKQGRIAEAIEHYRAALRVNPRYLPAMTNLANALFAVGAPTQAFDLLKQALEVNPDNYQIYMQAGLMCGYLKDFAEAERLYRAAATRAPEVAECWNNLGAAQFEQGHIREALWSFDHAVRLRPDFEQAQANLERAKRQLGASSQQ